VWKADAVFIGTVVDRLPERIGDSLSWTVHKVAVGQTLRGSVDSFIPLVPGNLPGAGQIAAAHSPRAGPMMWWSSCEYDFELGKQYLIYARRTSDGRWTTGKGSGTKPLEEAAADLDYIATIPSAEPTGRVYGTVERTVLNPAGRTLPMSVPAADVQIAFVSGTNRLTVRTDLEGKLDVHVPPGVYSIAPIVSKTVRVYGAPSLTTVPARGCAPVYFSLTANGRIEGRVVRSDGTPAPRTSIDVVPADLASDERPDNFTTSPSGTTDEKGRFSIDAILPGRYVVAVNARSGPRLYSPYPTTYFPGVGRQDARIVEIGEGERKSGLTIVVSALAETTVSGTVVINGGPAVEATVTASPVDQRGILTDSVQTDSSGAFELRVLTGISYLIRAEIRTESGFRQAETVVIVDQRKKGLQLSIRP